MGVNIGDVRVRCEYIRGEGWHWPHGFFTDPFFN